MAQLPRRIHLEIPFQGQETKTYDAEYSVFDRQSTPPCDLQKCFSCHRPLEFGCAPDCRYKRAEKRQAAALKNREAQAYKSKIAELAEQAARESHDKVCEDYNLGLCTSQDDPMRCSKGLHIGPPGPCNLGPPKGELRKQYLGLTPPWNFCKMGPDCHFDHSTWTPNSMKQALRKRDKGESSTQDDTPRAGKERCVSKHNQIVRNILNNINDFSIYTQERSVGRGLGPTLKIESGRRRGLFT